MTNRGSPTLACVQENAPTDTGYVFKPYHRTHTSAPKKAAQIIDLNGPLIRAKAITLAAGNLAERD